jgi:GAF domain-containing protein
MRKRSRAGGRLIKGPRPKTPKPVRRSAPKAKPRSQSSPTAEEVARLTRENVGLLSELRESLHQRTATSEVLDLISRSTFDLTEVLNTVLELAAGLSKADKGVILRNSEGASYYAAATYQHTPEFIESQKGILFEPGRGGVVGRVLLEAKSVQISDVFDDPEYVFREFAKRGGFRTILGVPLVQEGAPIGVFVLHRAVVKPFTEEQVKLVESFAAQAVIAIENARLLNELRQRTADLTERTADLTEALEQQTATSEVLRVVSSSGGDVEPVFATMLDKAVRICEASFGNIYRWDGKALQLVATHNTPPAFAEARSRLPLRPGTNSLIGRMLATNALVHIADVASTQAYEQKVPETVAAVELGGVRTILGVPMHHESALIGSFTLYRKEVRPFTDKQIELVKNFAAQAVIAIENARLLNELHQRTDDLSETLEQQTASAKVFEVISRSAFDLHAVFETVAESSVRLCEADRAFIFQYDGELLQMKAFYNASPELADWVREHPVRPGNHLASARAALHRQTIHIPDVQVDPDYFHGGRLVEPFRTVLAVPVLLGDDLLGVILIYHLEVRPLTAKQIALIETFADQAAIAIENTRLLQELRRRTDEVVNLNQQLEQRVADQVDEIERMGRLRRFLPPQVADLIVASGSEKHLESHRREITALFCDLRGFTGFTESADAEDVMALLRDYHAAIGEIIIKYNGTLERYAGDGVMVVFNDPVPVENPALQAVLMALEVRGAIGALTERWRRWGHDLGFGIGIAHGFATLGTIGFEGRFDYAAIGTVSNVASRLCDEAKPGQILISPRVLTKVENAVKVEPVGEFELKGIRRPLAAYNVIGAVS